MRFGAVVLCGGESRRMGRPKAWLPFGDELMLQRVVRLAGTVAQPTIVVAAPAQELPALAADVAIVRDPVSGRGPLQGLAAGLAAFDNSVELVYATATDVPFLEPRWMTRLVELAPATTWSFPTWRVVTTRWRPSIDRPRSCRRSKACSLRIGYGWYFLWTLSRPESLTRPKCVPSIRRWIRSET